MSYNVTILDAQYNFNTVYLAPDRHPQISDVPVATNHQGDVEWSHHARFTATVERERFLLDRLNHHPESEKRFIDAFLRPPLYSTAFKSGFGTLYTAVYRPAKKQLQLLWPGASWDFSLSSFSDGERKIRLPMEDACVET